MNAIMIANAIIEVAWLAATVVLVLTGHPGWAAATLIGALFSGWTQARSKPAGGQ